MEPIVRAAVIYFVLMLILRISGKRSLSSVTIFDFVLVLIIAESTQQALLGPDYSLTNAVLVISTLVGLDIGISLLTRYMPGLEKVIDSAPLLLVDDGRLLKDRMEQERIAENDILEMARKRHGLERLDQIRYAVLERGGEINIVPK